MGFEYFPRSNGPLMIGSSFSYQSFKATTAIYEQSSAGAVIPKIEFMVSTLPSAMRFRHAQKTTTSQTLFTGVFV